MWHIILLSVGCGLVWKFVNNTALAFLFCMFNLCPIVLLNVWVHVCSHIVCVLPATKK